MGVRTTDPNVHEDTTNDPFGSSSPFSSYAKPVWQSLGGGVRGEGVLGVRSWVITGQVLGDDKG